MGRCGFEPQTFRIWAGCSNQLSYLPKYDVSYESRTHNPYGNCFWGSRVYQFRQRNKWWFRRELNSHTNRHQNLNMTYLPLHHAGMYYSEPDLHRQAISATGLKPVVFPNFTIRAFSAEGWTRTINMQIFNLSLLPAELLPHKKW